MSCQNSQLQNAIPSPNPTRASQLPALPATFTDAAPSDVLADFSLSKDFVGPAVVDELLPEVVMVSTSVGWAAFEPGRVHVGDTLVSPWSYAFAVAQFPTLKDRAEAPASSSSEQST